MWCAYAFGTNTTVGERRMVALDARMRTLGLPYERVAARGPVRPFVPCLKQPGYVGMWRSMVKVWRRAVRECPHEWVLVLESDALLPVTFARVARHALRPPYQVVWLDARAGVGPGPSGCCTNAVAYRRSALPALLRHFDPHDHQDALWNGYARRHLPVVRDPTCLTDWYLANVVATLQLPAWRQGIVPHPPVKSELGSILGP